MYCGSSLIVNRSGNSTPPFPFGCQGRCLYVSYWGPSADLTICSVFIRRFSGGMGWIEA